MNNPTTQTYSSLTDAYNFFNKELFAGTLPPCLITMQRHYGAYGYFSSERFANTKNPDDITDEIALNPTHFDARKPEEVLSTLVHEMVHLWQYHFGKQPRRGYHDKQWASKMIKVGLTPTATGQQGGKLTGQQMTHIIDDTGLFAQKASKFLASNPTILYQDRASLDDKTRLTKKASKTKYSCPVCDLNAWAKPNVVLICGNCKETLQAI